MNIELLYKKKIKIRPDSPILNIKNSKSKTLFIFSDREGFNFANNSKDFLNDFYNLINSREEFKNTKLRNAELSLERLFSKEVLGYISKTPYQERQNIISSLQSLSQTHSGAVLSNKASQFMVSLKRLSRQYNIEGVHTPLTNTLKTLHKDTLLRETYIHTPIENQACKESYLGFIRAIRAGTLTTAKVMIDGKETRVFIKSAAGTAIDPNISKSAITHLKNKTRDLNVGYNTLAIDPHTLKFYTITTKGKKHYAEKATQITDLRKKDRVKIESLLKTELKNHLNQVYAKRNEKGEIVVPGIRRMKELHERMKTPKDKKSTVKKPKLTKNKKLRSKIRIKPR